jgi:SAM-dependent methyltransferase
MERGVFSNFSLLSQQGKGHTLDLCCGDGFFAYYFYSLSSETVTAIDFDPLAIDYAKLNYRRDNIKFILGDVRTEIPAGPFSNIIWDAAIEHFTESEIVNLMNKIKSVLAPQGILSGYTIQERHSHQKSLHQHEYEFADRDDLVRFLKPFFTNVHVIQTVYPDRTNFYFFATDGILPFDAYLNQTKITKY